MLTEKEYSEIREHLESSQNPVFFFDNDVDGLVSFLLLRRFIGRGKGVAIKSFPELDEQYTRKIEEFNADKVFILDKPLVSKGFLEYAHQHNIPVIWIDHHPPQNPSGEGVYYFNPLNTKPRSTDYVPKLGNTIPPTSYICWKTVKQDEWLAMIGCVADQYIPEFSEEFAKQYPDVLERVGSPEEALFESDLGRLVSILSHGLKDTTTNVMKMIHGLVEVKGPYEILVPDKRFDTVMSRYEELNKIHKKLLKKALGQDSSGKIILFKYSSPMAMSRGLSNELFYLNKGKKIVLVAHVVGDKVKISLTGPKDKDLRVAVAKALEVMPGHGGGHPQACGASVNESDFEKFREIIESYA